tara:strand:- start:2908 stop:3330 length:423 start_codon:yes stop_codon:yes gene_type:complete
MDWIYKGKTFVPPENFSPKEMYGFIYQITNTENNKKYIGKKFFWSKKTLPPLKGKKRKRRKIVESDWRTYCGSSANLVEDIEKIGIDKFHREILYIGTMKGELAYMEAKLQFDNEVLLKDDYYNGIINIRLGSNSVKILK